MKKQFIKTVVLAFIISLASCSENEEDKKIRLLETITEFNAAFQNGNVDLLESMITSDYVHTNGSSAAIKKENWLNYLNKRRQDILSGKIKPKSYNMNELKVHFYGNTAIVTAKIATQTEQQDTILSNAYRVTNLWVLENNQWKRAGFHDGKIK